MSRLDIVATGLKFPEGPVAMPDGSLVLTEIARRTVTRISASGEKTILADTGGGPNGLAVGPGGKLFLANNGGFDFIEDGNGIRVAGQAKDYSGGRIEQIDPASGAITEIARRADSGFDVRGPNDLVIDRSGAIWFSDLGKRRARELDYGGVYWLSPDRKTLREVAYPVLTANGIGLSPDEKTLYVADTEGGRLWAFDILGPGEVRKDQPTPHGGRLLYRGGGTGVYHRFDSMAVEAGGNICVATLVEGGITVVSPGGELVEFVPIPDRFTTNICFGGPDLRTAYITLSQSGRLASMRWPRPGLPLNFLNT